VRLDPLDVRKATLATVLARAAPGLRFNEHLDEEDSRWSGTFVRTVAGICSSIAARGNAITAQP
jgi:hypothetical protein